MAENNEFSKEYRRIREKNIIDIVNFLDEYYKNIKNNLSEVLEIIENKRKEIEEIKYEIDIIESAEPQNPEEANKRRNKLTTLKNQLKQIEEELIQNEQNRENLSNDIEKVINAFNNDIPGGSEIYKIALSATIQDKLTIKNKEFADKDLNLKKEKEDIENTRRLIEREPELKEAFETIIQFPIKYEDLLLKEYNNNLSLDEVKELNNAKADLGRNKQIILKRFQTFGITKFDFQAFLINTYKVPNLTLDESLNLLEKEYLKKFYEHEIDKNITTEYYNEALRQLAEQSVEEVTPEDKKPVEEVTQKEKEPEVTPEDKEPVEEVTQKEKEPEVTPEDKEPVEEVIPEDKELEVTPEDKEPVEEVTQKEKEPEVTPEDKEPVEEVIPEDKELEVTPESLDVSTVTVGQKITDFFRKIGRSISTFFGRIFSKKNKENKSRTYRIKNTDRFKPSQSTEEVTQGDKKPVEEVTKEEPEVTPGDKKPVEEVTKEEPEVTPGDKKPVEEATKEEPEITQENNEQEVIPESEREEFLNNLSEDLRDSMSNTEIVQIEVAEVLGKLDEKIEEHKRNLWNKEEYDRDDR